MAHRPESRRPALRERTKYLLRLVVQNKQNGVGPSQMQVVNAMQRHVDLLESDAGDIAGTFKNYMNGTRLPQPLYAWALGEALRDVGIRWMNGFCMLWTTGAYDVALATTIEYVIRRDNEPAPDEIKMLWAAAVGGTNVTNHRSMLDFREEVLRHVAAGGTTKIEPFLDAFVAAPHPEAPFQDSPHFAPEVQARYQETVAVLARDLDLRRWRSVVPYMHDLESAFRTVAGTKEYLPCHERVADDPWAKHSEADRLATVAIDLGRASGVSLPSLESAILIILGQYLNMLDPDRNGGARSLRAVTRYQST